MCSQTADMDVVSKRTVPWSGDALHFQIQRTCRSRLVVSAPHPRGASRGVWVAARSGLSSRAGWPTLGLPGSAGGVRAAIAGGAWSIACGNAHSAGLEPSEERSHGGGPAVRSKGDGGECGLEAGRAFVLMRQRRGFGLEQALGDGPWGESGPGSSSNGATWT